MRFNVNSMLLVLFILLTLINVTIIVTQSLKKVIYKNVSIKPRNNDKKHVLLLQKSKEELYEMLQKMQIKLQGHQIYHSIITPSDLKTFMEHHVFAVWDFMSLVKRLQRDLTSTNLVWESKEYKVATRMINEIILGEESDDITDEGYISHFELYKKAMNEVNAEKKQINCLTDSLKQYHEPNKILKYLSTQTCTNEDVKKFISETFKVIIDKSTSFNLGYFYYGREHAIPPMFQKLHDSICVNRNTPCPNMKKYLIRHIQVDSESHAPMSEIMMKEVSNGDETEEKEMIIGGIYAIENRIDFWTNILNKM